MPMGILGCISFPKQEFGKEENEANAMLSLSGRNDKQQYSPLKRGRRFWGVL